MFHWIIESYVLRLNRIAHFQYFQLRLETFELLFPKLNTGIWWLCESELADGFFALVKVGDRLSLSVLLRLLSSLCLASSVGL